VIEEEGYDAAEVDQRIADDKARADRLGLNFTGVPTAHTLIGAQPLNDDSDQASGGDAPAEDGAQPAPAPAPGPVKKTTPPKPKPAKP
jgi:hypothetical protein